MTTPTVTDNGFVKLAEDAATADVTYRANGRVDNQTASYLVNPAPSEIARDSNDRPCPSTDDLDCFVGNDLVADFAPILFALLPGHPMGAQPPVDQVSSNAKSWTAQ